MNLYTSAYATYYSMMVYGVQNNSTQSLQYNIYMHLQHLFQFLDVCHSPDGEERLNLLEGGVEHGVVVLRCHTFHRYDTEELHELGEGEPAI